MVTGVPIAPSAKSTSAVAEPGRTTKVMVMSAGATLSNVNRKFTTLVPASVPSITCMPDAESAMTSGLTDTGPSVS